MQWVSPNLLISKNLFSTLRTILPMLTWTISLIINSISEIYYYVIGENISRVFQCPDVNSLAHCQPIIILVSKNIMWKVNKLVILKNYSIHLVSLSHKDRSLIHDSLVDQPLWPYVRRIYTLIHWIISRGIWGLRSWVVRGHMTPYRKIHINVKGTLKNYVKQLIGFTSFPC